MSGNNLKNPDKLNNYLTEIKNLKEFEQKITNTYINEFEEKISNILYLSESEFMIIYAKRMILILKNDYSEEAFEDDIINLNVKQAEIMIYENFFKPIKNLLLKAINDYESMIKSTKSKIPSDIYITTNFKRHCLKCDDFAFHNCNSKFIPVYTNYINNPDRDLTNKIPKEGLTSNTEKNFENLTFVICVGCKKAYFSKEIQMLCQHCSQNYLTSIIRSEDVNLQPATWETYHCGALINETMKCIKCKDIFYVNINENCLECIKCNFKCDPLSIFWTCFLCFNEFSSNVKIYNPLEFKLVKQAINDAIIEKRFIKPLEISCCKLDILKTRFFHKKECDGSLYEGILDNQTIVVCEKCKAMNFYYRFVWTCPKCYKRFNQKKKIMMKIDNENSKIEETQKIVRSRKMVLSDVAFGKKLKKINDNELNQEKLKKNELDVKKSHPNFGSLNLTKSKSNNEFIENIHAKSKLRFTPYEKCLGISMLRYTKIFSKNVKTEELETEENSNYENNALTTEMDLETEINEKKGEINEIVRKKVNFKTYNFNPIENNPFVSKIMNHRNNSPVKNNENNISDNEQLNLKNNLQLLNPFRHKKIQLDAKIDRIIKKEFEQTKTKYASDIQSIFEIKNVNNEEDENDKILQKRKTKNININLNFRTIDNFNNNDNSELEQIKDQLEFENLNNDLIAELEQNVYLQKPLPFFIVEDYRFVHQIGDGSFGCIYLCMDKNEQKFAIKKIIVKDKEKIEQISSEFELTNQMKHKNILQIHGLSKRKLDSTTQVLYVLMELAHCDWKNEINKRIKNGTFYSESELIEILSQITEALAFLQKKNIAHRDIKPQNILYFKNDFYKIADFGCAKEMNMSMLNSLKGTELFISPILFESLKNNNICGVDHNVYKSDVYSLGLCILYAATLSINPITELRRISDQIISYNLLKKSLASYSQGFINLLYRMLDLNEELRLDFIELQEYLLKK